MNYFIVAVDNNGREFLGTQNATIVRDAKSMVKVNNALKSFNPTKETKQIKVYRGLKTVYILRSKDFERTEVTL